MLSRKVSNSRRSSLAIVANLPSCNWKTCLFVRFFYKWFLDGLRKFEFTIQWQDWSRGVTQFEEGRGLVTTHLEARGLKAEDLDAFQKIFLHFLTIKHGAFNCIWKSWKLSSYWLKTNLQNLENYHCIDWRPTFIMFRMCSVEISPEENLRRA